MTSRFPSAVAEMTVVHIFIRCFFSLNQLELEARPMLYHLPVSCTQPPLSPRPHRDPRLAPRPPASPRPGHCSPPPVSLRPMAGWRPGVLVPQGAATALGVHKTQQPGEPWFTTCPSLPVPRGFPSSLPQAQGGGDRTAWLSDAICIHLGARGGVRTLGPAWLIPAWSPGPPGGELTASGMAVLGHPGRTCQTPSLQDVPPSPSPPWGGSVTPDPSGGSLGEQAAWPPPWPSGTPGLWGWDAGARAGWGCPVWVLPVMGRGRGV